MIIDNERTSAAVADESQGGIGITLEMDDTLDVQVGDPLVVLQDDYPTSGEVQWMQQDPEAQKVRLGIRWT